MAQSSLENDSPDDSMDASADGRESVDLEPIDPLNKRLAALARMQVMEGEMARAKLRSRGVSCFIADENIVITDPLVFPYVTLQVLEEDLERARAILAEPAEAGPDDEYADERWRCPQCRRKAVELMPMSRRLKRIVAAFVLLALLPFAIAVAYPFLPDLAREWISGLTLLWCLLVLVLGISMVFHRRQKRCGECGHEW